MSNLMGFEQYWKLPFGFLSGNPQDESLKSCGVIENPGTSRGLRRSELGDTSIFCETGWHDVPSGLHPLLDLRDPRTGESIAVVATTADGGLYCPFNVQAVIEAFQLERYSQSAPSAGRLQHARRLYYLLRPFIPRALQIMFRQSIVPLQGQVSFPSWPLDTSLDDFLQLLLRLILQANDITQVPFIWFWPEGYSHAVVLTHDVETQAGIGLSGTSYLNVMTSIVKSWLTW
jgi:hypothetical protein